MSSLYYLGLGAVSLSMTIYNFHMVGEATNQTCYSYQTMTYDDYKNYNISLGLEIYNKTSFNIEYFEVPVTEGNIYKTLTLIIAIIYIIYLVLSLFLSCVSNMMSNQTPEDYIKIGTCKKFLACFCKILPPVLIILSWVNFILFVVFWILITVGKCEYNSDIPGIFIDKKDYFNDNKVLILVNSCFWILLHYGGAIVRGMTYVEPFMYSPEIGKPNMIKTLLFKKLGP